MTSLLQLGHGNTNSSKYIATTLKCHVVSFLYYNILKRRYKKTPEVVPVNNRRR